MPLGHKKRGNSSFWMDLEDTMLRVTSQLGKFKLSNFIQMWKIKMISELEKQRKLLDYKIKKRASGGNQMSRSSEVPLYGGRWIIVLKIMSYMNGYTLQSM